MECLRSRGVREGVTRFHAGSNVDTDGGDPLLALAGHTSTPWLTRD